MGIVLSDAQGVPFMQTDDFELDHQCGSRNNFELKADAPLQAHYRFQIDGTSVGGFLDTPCPTKTSKGESIKYKGRTFEGAFEKKILFPPSGKTHLTFKGDANALLAEIVSITGLSNVFEADTEPSGLPEVDCRFYRFVNSWDGMRMALASVGARPEFECRDGLVLVRAVPSRDYGRLDSERVYFKLNCEKLPCNHLTGLGKGEGLSRSIVHWYADLFGNVSQTQTLFGEWENAETYTLNTEEGQSLSSKTKAKLSEYQEGSKAEVEIPESVKLSVDDSVSISSAEFNLEATTQVIDVVTKASGDVLKRSYRFGIPDFPDEEEE